MNTFCIYNGLIRFTVAMSARGPAETAKLIYREFVDVYSFLVQQWFDYIRSSAKCSVFIVVLNLAFGTFFQVLY